MALCKRGKIWWIRICHTGRRVQKSTGTSDKIAAKRLHGKIKADLWKVDRLKEKPTRTWMEAVMRWLLESQHKRSLVDDKTHLRWLSQEEAIRLIQQLPSHLADLVTFSLATGLRKSNVTGLQWSEVDLVRRHALIHPDQAKAKKAIPVPLNDMAVSVIRKQLGKHQKFVFTYQGNRIIQTNTKAWKKALARAGIENFRWHDLRHTWASWHIQNGTSLQELQQLGGWASFEMVLRYAHLSSHHLKNAANRISGYNLGTSLSRASNSNL